MVVNDRLFNMDVIIFRGIVTSKIGTRIVVTDAFARLHICQKCLCRAAAQVPLGKLTTHSSVRTTSVLNFIICDSKANIRFSVTLKFIASVR